MRAKIFDSTLRDGAQAEGISFLVGDKIKIAKALDDLGVDFIEAGNPGSNQKDMEFFQVAKNLTFKHSKLVAFGSTRRCNIEASDDANLNALLEASTDYVCIFGKSWDFHVTEIINTSLEENISMIKDTIIYLKSKNKHVFFDAEHFFDGFKGNKEYALKTLKAAEDAGAECIILCDTNGGTFPDEMVEIIKEVKENINNIFNKYNYLIDTHTCVAYTSYEKYLKNTKDKTTTVIVSTASPYKFSKDVLNALGKEDNSLDEFQILNTLSKETNTNIPLPIKNLKTAKVLHNRSCEKYQIKKEVENILKV